MKIGHLEQLLQLFNGVTRDGNLLSKSYRTDLVKRGLAEQVMGWNLITPKGASCIINLGVVSEQEKYILKEEA